jgi:hypothetical protein
MIRAIGCLSRLVTSLWHDTSGLMLPYVTVMLPVLVGFGLLALDGARHMSLQTQMQEAADALALAGARELNQQSGAQTRAIDAMANAYGSATVPNSLLGMGTAPTLTYTYTFYNSLPAATSGLTGTAAAGDTDSKYVKVTVSAVTVPTIFPVSYVSTGNSSFASGASAIAGFAGITVCAVTPLFICNPYETAGMSDAQATTALQDAFADPATLRKMFRMDRSSTSPGHFGWVQTADGCNNTNCQRTNLAAVSGACYNSYNVALATGNKNSVEQYIDTRFDIYSQNPSPGISASDAPAVNVRKGYLPTPPKGNQTVNWCSAAPVSTNLAYYTTPTWTTTLTAAAANSATLNVASTANMALDPNGNPTQYIKGGAIPANTTITTINSATQITISNKATIPSGTTLTIEWFTSGLLQDKQWTGLCSGGPCLQGNGDWDCADYWSINHTAAAPAGCTASNPTISRYQVYRYEIANNLINDWSGNRAANSGKNPAGNGENGAPFCAAGSGVSGVDTTTGGLDRRDILVPIINCLAQTALGNIVGGNNASNVPVAAFVKFFLTQPYEALGDYLYGEMTGAVGSNDNVIIYNQVQLYR